MIRPSPVLVGVLVACAIAAGHAQAPALSGEPHRFLRTVARFSDSDLALLERGQPVARVLDTDKRELAVVGAVRINARRERLFDRFRDVSSLKSSDVVMELGKFGDPPKPEDLNALHFETYDLETIKACRPGDCGVRLSTENMERFAREVNWRAPDWPAQAATLWRQLLAKDGAQYMATGKLGDYRNKAVPLSVAGEFDILYAASSYFEQISPQFFAYLKNFPHAPLDGVENILYWSKDDINRPVTRVTHLILYPPGADAQRPGLAATKQIYAAHYFDAGLGFTAAFSDGRSGFYMLVVNRVRTRSLTGLVRAMVRSVVQRRSRDAMEGILRSTKTGLENRR